MLQPKIEDNLVFIWRELMNERARQLAKRSLLLVLLGSALLIAIPYAVGMYIDGLTTEVLDALLVGGILFVAFEVNNIWLGWWRQQVRERFFQEEFWYLPQVITQKYLMRPLSFLSGRESEIDGGSIESLRDKVWDVIVSYIYQIVPSYGQVLFGLLACLYANVWLGPIATLYVMIERHFGKRDNEYVQRALKPIIAAFKRWERRMQEWWHSVDHVKNQGVETKVLRQIHSEVQEPLRRDDAVWRIFFARAIVKHRIRSLTSAVVLYGSLGYLVFGSMVSLASAVLVFFSFERIRSLLGEINDQQREVQFNLASIAKYRRILTEPVPFKYDTGCDFDGTSIAICFSGVYHSVQDGVARRQILRSVDISIPAGEKVGIVGPSGAGKSQLLSLLVRATDPDQGQVLINGQDLRELKLESLLRYYGVIMQKSEPFEDTVLGNLLFGVSHLDTRAPFDSLVQPDQEVVLAQAHLALQKAGLDIGQFPQGVMTNIGYKGMKLSGGQQQRLQIASAHYKLGLSSNCPRLILADEPTSSLDSLSEIAVMGHLQETLPVGTTMLMVAHRPSTVANMDRIVFVRPLEQCSEETAQVTVHASLAELYRAEALFREMADAQGFRP